LCLQDRPMADVIRDHDLLREFCGLMGVNLHGEPERLPLGMIPTYCTRRRSGRSHPQGRPNSLRDHERSLPSSILENSSELVPAEAANETRRSNVEACRLRFPRHEPSVAPF
jgi:hypothetical protein